MDSVFIKFRGFVDGLVSPLFAFEMKNGAWRQKSELVDLTLHTAFVNSYAEGVAETLREKKHVPTLETLPGYFKSASWKTF